VPAALGWAEEEILGRPLSDFVGEADLAAAIPALRAGREMHLPAVRLSDRQGHARPASFALLPLRDNDKVVGGVVLVRYLPPG
jgi:hypothetical protein